MFLLAATVAGAVAAVVLAAAGGSGPSTYRVDAIFDNADFLVPGQDVKIAGAVSGSVKAVRLTPDRKARVEMEVRPEFGPFRSDGSCSIRPQSLIGEKFVTCDPGTPKGRPLSERDGAPELPLARNHSPVDLDLVFSALRLPYRQRLSVLINELGVGLAGRPAELNAAIRRANPALQRTNQVLSILARDRQTLGHLIDASDRVIGQLAAHHGDVSSFIDRADRVAATVAGRRGDLGLAIRRLPPMLDQLEPAADDLAGLATDARPVANDLRAAATPVRNLLGDLGPLTDAARPTLVALNDLSRTGRHSIRSLDPVARLLLPAAQRLPETMRLARALNLSLRAQGVPEGLLSFLYYGTSAQARFDRFSHILPSYQIAGTCQQYATTPVAGCSANWNGGPGAQGTGDRAQKRRDRKRARRHRRASRGVKAPPQTPGPAPPPSAVRGPRSPAAVPPEIPQPAPAAPPQITQILDYLLHP